MRRFLLYDTFVFSCFFYVVVWTYLSITQARATILLHPKMRCILYKVRVFTSAEAAVQGPGTDLAHSLYTAKACGLSHLLKGLVVSVTTIPMLA